MLGDIPQIAGSGWTPESLCLVILDGEPNRFTPFLSMQKHTETLVPIKAQDEQYCKYKFPLRSGACQEGCTASKDLNLQEHYSRLTREGADLYAVRYGKKNNPDESMTSSRFEM